MAACRLQQDITSEQINLEKGNGIVSLIESAESMSVALPQENGDDSSGDSNSEAEDEDVAVDDLRSKGWKVELEPQTQHEMNGVVLPNNEDSVFGDVTVKNSSNVHVGSRVFYKGPVTIKQFVYTNATTANENEAIDYSGNETNNHAVNESNSASKDSVSSLHPFPTSKPYRVLECLKTRRMLSVNLCGLALVLIIIIIWLSISGTKYRMSSPYVPTLPNDSSINNDPTFTGVRIIQRVEWGAQPPVRTPKKLVVDPAPLVIISHTATIFCYTQAQCVLNVRVAQTFHIESRGWNDIAYNFLVGGDGLVYEGRGWGIEGSHTFNYNNKSIGISFIGTFNTEEPTKSQLYAAKKLIEYGVENKKISTTYKLLGHRQCIKTESPGEILYNIIKTWDHWSPTP